MSRAWYRGSRIRPPTAEDLHGLGWGFCEGEPWRATPLLPPDAYMTFLGMDDPTPPPEVDPGEERRKKFVALLAERLAED